MHCYAILILSVAIIICGVVHIICTNNDITNKTKINCLINTVERLHAAEDGKTDASGSDSSDVHALNIVSAAHAVGDVPTCLVLHNSATLSLT